MPEHESVGEAESPGRPPVSSETPAEVSSQVSNQPNTVHNSDASTTPSNTPAPTEETTTRSLGEAPSSSIKPSPRVTSAHLPGTPMVIVSTAPVRSSTPLLVGTRVVLAAGVSAQAAASGVSVTSNQVRGSEVSQAPIRGPAVTQAPIRGPAVTQAPIQGPVVTQASIRGPAVTQASIRGPAVTQASIRGPAVTQALIRGPAVTQAPIQGTAVTQAPIRGPAGTQAPIRGPAVTQAPIRGPAVTQAPIRGPAVTQAPIQGTAVTQAPIRGPAVTQAPIRGPAVTQAPIQGPAVTQAPIRGPAVTQAPIRGPAVTQAPIRGTVVTLSRLPTPQQNVALTQRPQSSPLQLPANFTIPQDMVLIRSDSGQLMLVSQQALAQAQAQGIGSKPSTATTTVRPQTSQTTATAKSIIRITLPPSSATAASTIVKPAAPATATTVLKPTTTSTVKPSNTTGGTIIKTHTVLATPGIMPTSKPGTTVIKTTVAQKSSVMTSTGSVNQKSTSVPNTSTIKTIGKACLSSLVTQTVRPLGSGPRMISPNIPIKSSSSKAVTPVSVTAETLENVKKCKNFLITLMKLASSGTRSADMAQNVQALVKDLLDGRLEAEEFTEKLYMELKSSPQPYLVPFLKRSLPAVRQLTPNSQLFIQQCVQPKSSPSSTVSSSTEQSSLPSTSATSQPLKTSVQGRPAQLVIHQPKGVTVEQRVTSSPRVVFPVQNRTQSKQPIIQSSTQAAAALGRLHSLQAPKAPSGPAQAAHTHSFKDNASGSFRDDDDINDVASMAGVNLNEENARILASSSELVGTVVHSCRDEPFLHTPALQHKVLHIGSSMGIAEVNPEVMVLLSHATQERLQDLLEKLSSVAQHHSRSYRDNWRYTQTSDTRSQLKFLEQLEKIEKQRREEEERETLLRIAKSRTSSEDPEQLRLKQRAKEMQQLELAQMEHRDANLAALAALGPRKRKPVETFVSGTNQGRSLSTQRPVQRGPTRVTLRDLLFCMEQDRTLKHSLLLYNAFLK